jgi:hypothetical protein
MVQTNGEVNTQVLTPDTAKPTSTIEQIAAPDEQEIDPALDEQEINSAEVDPSELRMLRPAFIKSSTITGLVFDAEREKEAKPATLDRHR